MIATPNSAHPNEHRDTQQRPDATPEGKEEPRRLFHGIKHKEDCPYQKAMSNPVGIECKHGYDVCPECDPCTCKQDNARKTCYLPSFCPNNCEDCQGDYLHNPNKTIIDVETETIICSNCEDNVTCSCKQWGNNE